MSLPSSKDVLGGSRDRGGDRHRDKPLWKRLIPAGGPGALLAPCSPPTLESRGRGGLKVRPPVHMVKVTPLTVEGTPKPHGRPGNASTRQSSRDGGGGRLATVGGRSGPTRRLHFRSEERPKFKRPEGLLGPETNANVDGLTVASSVASIMRTQEPSLPRLPTVSSRAARPLRSEQTQAGPVPPVLAGVPQSTESKCRPYPGTWDSGKQNAEAPSSYPFSEVRRQGEAESGAPAAQYGNRMLQGQVTVRDSLSACRDMKG